MEQSDILRNLRIEQLTPMQEAARDAYQSDKDLVLLSPTGAGKTLAFLAYRRWCSYRRASLPCR